MSLYIKRVSVIYEDNHLIIVNKPAGMLAQSDSTGDKSLLDEVKEYLKKKYDKPGEAFLGLVHRIDRPVSGLVVLAKTSKALERMNEIFRKRKVQKTYWAVVHKKPPKLSDKLVHYLVKNSATNKVEVFETEVKNSQKAELTYRLLGKINTYYLLEIEPLTGRPHQIRSQLSSIGCPIKGDVKYGFDRANSDKSINLHARRLFFEHPTKKEPMLCRAALPNQAFWEEFLPLDTEIIKDEMLPFLHE